MQTREQLITIVMRDPVMTQQEKAEVIAKLNDHSFINHISRGVVGAGVGLIIAKFMGLSKSAQVLLSLAGFGIGKYLLDVSRKHDKFLQYNERLKVYDIKA